MSRLADNIESVQLGTATELLEQAPKTLGTENTDPDELRRLTRQLADALRDVLRIATSRGHLLAASEPNHI
ncbi:hypothetical protein [Streptomyces sp. NPDC002265]|uniref:hypothetical protein n=1 Tax=Streptomyces sp. NPDC002265 TaxID=3154415 RepID=UPI003326357C